MIVLLVIWGGYQFSLGSLTLPENRPHVFLDRIAADDNADVPALRGWRRELFGEHALALKAGRVALTARGSRTQIVEIGKDPG